MSERTPDVPSVLQVNTHDAGGGAARVMRDLHDAYLASGLDSWMAVGYRSGDDDRILRIDNEARRGTWSRAFALTAAAIEGERPDPGRLRRALSRAFLATSAPARYRRIFAGLEDMDFPATRGLLDLPPSPSDVLHLHNLHGYYFDLRLLPQLTARTPAIVTLHDTWLLTGHCAHPFGCERWRTGCGDCPDLGMYVPIRGDASAENRALKRDVVRRSGVGLAVPSRWLLRMAEESGIPGDDNDVRLVPNGIDTSVFQPGDPEEARHALDLPSDRPIVLVAGQHLETNPFKDFATFLAALPLLPSQVKRDILVVALGTSASPETSPVEIRAVPYVSDVEDVARYYRAADVYVHSSRADNLPLAVLEAAACGTAIVANDVGGIPEIVTDGKTGLLVPAGEAPAMAAAIERLLGDADLRHALAEAALARVREQFTLERQVDAYRCWYDELRVDRGQNDR